MDTIEEKLKRYIRITYGSVNAFVQEHGLVYSNVDTILRRGIKNATWSNVKAFCQALGISADEVGKGNIVPAASVNAEPRNIRELINASLLLDGQPLTEQEHDIVRTAVQVAIAVIRDKRI